MDKFLGVGLMRALALAIFVMLVIVGTKVIFTKYYVSGVTEFVNAI
ncbi:MAG: hypothetical protein DDT22_00863 [candidate division WS2 bacterium]|nr:hypothetical protein [Candidatus Lithacetigena glycinireducens]